MATRKISRGPSQAREHAQLLAERVAEKWFGHHGSGDIDIAVSTVAALALLHPPYPERDAVALEWMGLPDDQFAGRMRGLWRWFMLNRPDLANPVSPLVLPWLGDKPMEPETLRAAHHVADVVLGNGLLWLTGDLARRDEVDLLGIVLTLLRPKSALQGRGQFYTPDPLTEFMSAMLLSGGDGADPHTEEQGAEVAASLVPTLKAGQSMLDPCCGTGGMLRGMAVSMRQAGIDPATAIWAGVDIDYLAVACAAVNAELWQLGYQVVLWCGDSLAEPDFWGKAVAQRNETVELMRDMLAIQQVQALVAGTKQLVDLVAAEAAAGDVVDDDTDDPTDASVDEAPVAVVEPDLDTAHQEPTQEQPEPSPTLAATPQAPPGPVLVATTAPIPVQSPTIDLDEAGRDALAADLWSLVDQVAAEPRRTA
jgi:hypothetical protein